jgi:hypothetical protein
MKIRWMKNFLVLPFFFLVLSLIVYSEDINQFKTNQDLTLALSLYYDDGSISIEGVEIVNKQIKNIQENGDYIIRLVNEDSSFNDYFFNIPNLMITDFYNESTQLQDGEEIVLNNVHFKVYLPYDPHNNYLLEIAMIKSLYKILLLGQINAFN